MNDDRIEILKRFNNLIKKSKTDSKLDYCLCCKKNVTSFCKSHSLPKFVLKNIGDNGMVLNSNHYFQMPLIEELEGIKNSGVFYRICNKCDNEIFKDYESEEKLLELPRKKMMAQIDLKNSLKMYDKRLNEIELYKNMLELSDPSNELFRMECVARQSANYLDLNEIKNEFQCAFDILNKKSTLSYELIYWKVLDFVAPIAFQGHIALLGDLEGMIINNLYNASPKYIIENINICVFPLKENTVVMMFVRKDYRKYNNFIKQIKKLKDDEVLNLISYIICNYNEEFFISKNSSKEMLENENIENVTRNTTDILGFSEEMVNDLKKMKILELKDYKKFPNLLSKEYAINKNNI